MFWPAVIIILLLWIATAYGTVEQVNKNTNWQMIRTNDPNFNTYFYTNLLFSIGEIGLTYWLQSGMSEEYKNA